MRSGLTLVAAAMLLGGIALSADAPTSPLQQLEAKRAELDRLAREVAELEQQLERPSQVVIRFQMVELDVADWERLNPEHDAPNDEETVSKAWMDRLAELKHQKKVVVSSPTVLISNGAEARLVSGGAFPVPTLQGSGKIAVEWQKYGNIANVLPLIKGDGRIELDLTVENSSAGPAHEIQVNDIKVPSLIVTRFSSRVQARFNENILVGRLENDGRMAFLLVTAEKHIPVRHAK